LLPLLKVAGVIWYVPLLQFYRMKLMKLFKINFFILGVLLFSEVFVQSESSLPAQNVSIGVSSISSQSNLSSKLDRSSVKTKNSLSEFVEPLLPGDIIFCKGVVGEVVSPMLDATAFHDHLNIFLGKQEDFSKYLRKDQRKKYLDNWEIENYNPFNKIDRDSFIVYDVYPDRLSCGTNARFLDIRSVFFEDASAQRFPVPLSYAQREKIIQFLFDHIQIGFDHKGLNDETDNLWTCCEICEGAYRNAGFSFFEYVGLNRKFISAVEMPFLCQKGNAVMRQILSFLIIDFATVEVSDNFQDRSNIKYYAVSVTKDYGNGKIVNIIRIKHDRKIVDIFSELFGFKKEIAGPFDTEGKAIEYIRVTWGKKAADNLLKIKLK